jgi:nucleotide-binding universal stress UspA family protein
MKTILVPCDFSKPALEAFKMAVDIASKFDGTVTVLHVVYVPALYDPNFIGDTVAFNPSFLASLEDDAKKAFEIMRKEHGGKLKIDLQVVSGGIIESIHRITEEKKIDLIVMGTSGASGLQETLIGSNTEKVVRFSNVPVLAVRRASDVNSFRNMLLPTTGSLDQTDFIAKVKQLQEFLKATLHILLINTPGNFRRDAEAKQALEEFAKHYHLKEYQLHFKSYRTEEEGIIDFVSSSATVLVAMATHQRRGLAHLFSGSVTEDVVNHIQNTPVWTYSVRK